MPPHSLKNWNRYHKVASSSLSRLVAHLRIFRLFIKGKFDTYVLWPLAQRVQNWIVDRSTARDFTVTVIGIFLPLFKKIPGWLSMLQSGYWLWYLQLFLNFYWRIIITPKTNFDQCAKLQRYKKTFLSHCYVSNFTSQRGQKVQKTSATKIWQAELSRNFSQKVLPRMKYEHASH